MKQIYPNIANYFINEISAVYYIIYGRDITRGLIVYDGEPIVDHVGDLFKSEFQDYLDEPV